MGAEPYVEISSDYSVLHLCNGRKVEQMFKVALGRSGLGKARQGDRKTPLGTYTLGAPRESSRFHKFIPINYPDQSQREQGFTGGDVGLHGPMRGLSFLGSLNTFFDWTDGCVAVGTNQDIDQIAAWVIATKAQQILLR
jgi:murein L,D-transpeptidase YafK